MLRNDYGFALVLRENLHFLLPSRLNTHFKDFFILTTYEFLIIGKLSQPSIKVLSTSEGLGSQNKHLKLVHNFVDLSLEYSVACSEIPLGSDFV